MILSNDNEATLVLRNQLNASEVKDPVTPIQAILQRVNKREMMHLYKISQFEDVQQFLYGVAVAKGKFKRVN